ncbi:hypothetical protein [Melissospora conviva]|uniref:hypothetical protein n=1 Tax=Melissospora conviva TaxID=3388432 RepID=UPI003B7A8378
MGPTPPSSTSLAAEALLGLLLPFWQIVIGAFVLLAVIASVRKLAQRGLSRMNRALLFTAGAIVALALTGVLLQGA